MRRHAPPAALLALVLLALGPAAADAQAGTEAGVRYRTPETVYLDAGTLAGVDVGDRLEVVRGGETIGEVEVVFAAERSASCRVLSERTPIQAGDHVRLPGGGAVARPPEPGS
ncbi:MAG TPA: hypothetical protein VF121_00465, partial [Thermoanaerobaculia bacterium]|nr:hypothetical protein [Thermoanaerobaculia bacterium]